MTSESITPDIQPLVSVARLSNRLLGVWARMAIGLGLIAAIYALRVANKGPEEIFLWQEDLPVLAAFGSLLAALRFAPAAQLAGLSSLRLLIVAGLAVACAAAGYLGVRLVFEGYTLSLDEFMANFDATIFRHGAPLAPVPPQWRAYTPALQPIYTLQPADHAVWVSAYLPLNAVFRALGDLVGGRDWVNPIFNAVSVVAVYGVARRLWPRRPGLALAAAGLLATSSQVVVMGMTAYAMPAHLALNLTWLWLFLRGGKAGHGLALVVGFIACGLHQVIFHPLFVAPFILQLWLDKRWRTAGLYTAAYAAIGLFWVLYWSLVMNWAGVAPDAQTAAGGGGFVSRVVELLVNFKLSGLGVMAENLVRFAAWQNPLTTPLALIAGGAAFKAKGVMRSMALGIILTILAVYVLVPSQSHGWGYRYLHGLIGSTCLLAVWAWARLTNDLDGPTRARAGGLFMAGLAAGLIAVPIHAWQAHQFAHPYATAYKAIVSRAADVVLLDDATVGLDMGSFVRNDPFLTSRPKVLLLNALDGAALGELCGRYRVAVFDGRDPAAAGILTYPGPEAKAAADRRALLANMGCIAARQAGLRATSRSAEGR